jgi:hypothetical protein
MGGNTVAYKSYYRYILQFKDDTLIYRFEDFDIYQDHNNLTQFWKVYREHVSPKKRGTKAERAGSTYLTVSEARKFLGAIDDLQKKL